MIGLMVVGAILALMGWSIMSGLMATLIDVFGNMFVIGGIIAAVAGGAFIMFGSALNKIWGVGLLMTGMLLAVMGVTMRFVMDLWIIHWLINYGGFIMLIIGVVIAALGLIGTLVDALKGGGKEYRRF